MKKVTTKSAREFLNAVKLSSPTRGVVAGARELKHTRRSKAKDCDLHQ